MANELKRVYGTEKTLEANGASIASNAIGQANDADWSSSDTLDFPDAVFCLMIDTTGAMTVGTTLDLIIRPMNIDGTNDAEAPSATYLHHFAGSFRPTASTAAQYLYVEAKDVPKEGQAWIYNNATGQSVPAGWTLKMKPMSRAPS